MLLQAAGAKECYKAGRRAPGVRPRIGVMQANSRRWVRQHMSLLPPMLLRSPWSPWRLRSSSPQQTLLPLSPLSRLHQSLQSLQLAQLPQSLQLFRAPLRLLVGCSVATALIVAAPMAAAGDDEDQAPAMAPLLQPFVNGQPEMSGMQMMRKMQQRGRMMHERMMTHHRWMQMTPEERLQLRRDIREAGRALYPDRSGER